MSKITDNSFKSDFNHLLDTKPWWKRPLIGPNSLLEDWLSRFSKREVSENTLIIHQREMMDVTFFAKTAAIIDNLKFSNPEFILFIRIRYLLSRGLQEYEGLSSSIELLKVAIEAKDTFISIDQTELSYRGYKQQEFYQYVQECLCQQDAKSDKALFREQVQEKLTEFLPQIKTDEGKAALQSYAKHLEKLSETALGLKLLSLFKAYQLADYSILKTISDIITNLGKEDLLELKGLISIVIVNREVFEKVGKILAVPQRLNNPETYARMIHFIALSYRHSLSTLKFDELMGVMKKWYKHYQSIQLIRNQHPPSEYKLPKSMLEPLPGVEIYEKYKKWLTDKKTGMAYVDFDAEVSSVTTSHSK